MKIAFGCDHAGVGYRRKILDVLKKKGHAVLDFGCTSPESCDYPDIALAVARAVAEGGAERGILICGTGVGMSIAANKVAGIRAAVCWNDEVARLVSEHNDANVLCMGARCASDDDMIRWIDIWLRTPPSNDDRHRRRRAKITACEKGCTGGTP